MRRVGAWPAATLPRRPLQHGAGFELDAFDHDLVVMPSVSAALETSFGMMSFQRLVERRAGTRTRCVTLAQLVAMPERLSVAEQPIETLLNRDHTTPLRLMVFDLLAVDAPVRLSRR